MTFPSKYREDPPGYLEWPNNGEVCERLRCGLLEEADEAQAAGNVALADDLRIRADCQKRERNRCFREYERRLLNRSMNQRRTYGPF